jgi:hypothetical protein
MERVKLWQTGMTKSVIAARETQVASLYSILAGADILLSIQDAQTEIPQKGN